MSIETGQALPDANLTLMTPDGPEPIGTRELMGTGKTVLFAVPGAFTPTCSVQHLPGFVNRAAELREHGVDRIVCMAVNDIFVMDAWGKSFNVGQDIIMAADGNGEFTRMLGLEMDARAFGMGQRAKRFAMVIEDGTIKKLFVEAPGEFRVSSADHILQNL